MIYGRLISVPSARSALTSAVARRAHLAPSAASIPSRICVPTANTCKRLGVNQRFFTASSTTSAAAIAKEPAKASGGNSQHRAAMLLTASIAAATLASVVTQRDPALCHCQVPCGIFDDPVRVTLIREHAATIRKAVISINNLAGESPSPRDFNQASRWVAVKEQAASDIIGIVATYMLCQRVKRGNFATKEEYLQALELHHILMQAAMLSKQTVSETTCDALDKAIGTVEKMYTKA